ncbi:cysteine desulfurase family protein [Pararhizobium mangrovi]|uniref:Cysteine desulfurase n=1 Tax=Pararhizobium mangrovi TaxID=2590452 RepID=A0A506U0U0_9HYPH|nr:cysteine desulfurase family protein [Pararhizobium mangrovi]TPW26821.1 cysteine desulfurase [Pararhizobium mangrovi]
MTAERIYLDWNATAPLRAEARRATLDALDMQGNPSSVHREGRAARGVIDRARRQIAALVDADPAHVVFTSGASEAAAHVLTPDFRMGKSPLAVSHLYVSATEHPCVLAGGRFTPQAVTSVPVGADGILDLAALDRFLAHHDVSQGLPMIAVQLANNETGIVQPIAKIAEIVKKARGLLVVDAVQAAGRLPVSLHTLGADFLFLSSHKIGGPKGAGALVSAGEIMMPAPLVTGGGQEKGHRAGTENLPAIAGFGTAAEAALGEVEEYEATVGALRDVLEAGLRTMASDIAIVGGQGPRVANTTFFTLPGMKGETAQIAFDLDGVCLSSGSACSSGKVGPSHVLDAMGLDAETGGLRVSLGPTTTMADVERFLAVFSRFAERGGYAKRGEAAA